MKWIFLSAVILLAPALIALLRSNPRSLVPTCFVLGFSMFWGWTVVFALRRRYAERADELRDALDRREARSGVTAVPTP